MRLEGCKVTMTLSMLGNLGKLTLALIIRKVLVGSLNLAYLDALFAGLPLCLQRISLSGSIAPKRTVIYVAISLESNQFIFGWVSTYINIAKFEGINALICILGETN